MPDTSPQRNYAMQVAEDLTLADPRSAVPGQGPIIGTDGDLVFAATNAVHAYFVVNVAIP